jgi:coenzyme F420-reducing hydrogenase delta subunit
MSDFSPNIVALVCNWCTYTAADLAGVSRLEYPADVRLVRLMCTGMLDPKVVLQAFLSGADGVLVGGCHPGDCHYIDGNLKARQRIPGVRAILQQYGFEPERLRLQWIGASEGPEFRGHMQDFVDTVRGLGPSQARGKAVL